MTTPRPMQLVEQHVISKTDPRWGAIDSACFLSKNLYNAARFEELANIQDLMALLKEPPALLIHYPRPTQGNGFEWFMNNKDNKEGGRFR